MTEKPKYLKTHLAVVSLAITVIGIITLQLNRNTSLLALGVVAGIILHLITFAALGTFIGGWVTRAFKTMTKKA